MKGTAVIESAQSHARDRISDFSQLVKARLTFLVLVTAGVGFYLGTPGTLDPIGLLHVLVGTALAAAGASALNQWWERDLDALMFRTCTRPVPSGRMRPRNALAAGFALSVAGVAYLAVATNFLAAALAALTVLIYVLAYTPLKRVSTTNTLVGAVPGALPPVIGWVAARGHFDFAAWSLFAILFIWQIPHFFAIAWMCREDYARAGFQMLSSGDEHGLRSGGQAVLFAMILLLIAGIPAFIGLCGAAYLAMEIILSSLFTAAAMRFHSHADMHSARLLFLSSIVYLPLLLIAMMVTKL